MSFLLKYNSVDGNDEWIDKACPYLVLAMFFIIYIIPLTGFNINNAYINNHNTLKILLSILPSQIIFLSVILLSALSDKSNVNLKEKLSLINWQNSYFETAIKTELLLIAPLFITAALSYYLLMKIGLDYSTTPVMELLENASSTGIVIMIIFSVFLAPLVEELSFRRVIFTFISRRFGSGISIILTSFIFACMHGGLVQLIPLFILSLALQHLYIKNGSLFPSILLHSLHNIIVMSLFIIGRLAPLEQAGRYCRYNNIVGNLQRRLA